MKVQLAIVLCAIGAVACAQDIDRMDRMERSSLTGEMLQQDRGSNSDKNWGLSIMPSYTYVANQGSVFSGPGATVWLAPPHSHGIGATRATYRYDDWVEGGFPTLVRDLIVVDMRLTPDSFPFVVSGTYTNDSIRQDSRITGWGATASKSFNIASDQTLELSVTGTDERLSFPSQGNGPKQMLGFSTHGTVWDSSAALFLKGGFTLLGDYIYKSDFEGPTSWYVQASMPLGSHLRGRFGLVKNNIFTFQFGWKF